MFRIGAVLFVLIAISAPAVDSLAQELTDRSVEDLVAQEEIRSAVETAIDNYLRATGAARIDRAIEGIENLLPYGEQVVPYLAVEIEQEDYGTYDFLAYALGSIEGPAAEAALREAIARAEATPGAAALARKAWSCWALGLHGQIDALKLVNEGTHQAAKFPMHQQMTVIETVAVQTAPEAVQVLLQQLETWGDSEDKRGDQRFVLRSLRRLGHPGSKPALIAIIEQNEDEPALRSQAADALRSLETPDSVAALVTALEDPVPGVRRAAAFALKWMDRPGDLTKLLEHLTTEDDLRARDGLYGVIAAHVQGEQIPQYLAQWNRPDPEDRRLFITALPQLNSELTIPILSAALDDPSNAVAMLAVAPLAEIGGKLVEERLEELLASTDRWGVVREIAKAAAAKEMKALAPNLTQRMLVGLRLDPRTAPNLLSALERLADALVELRYAPALPKLRRAKETLKDPEMIVAVDGVIDSLELLRSNGKDVAKWIPLLKDPDRSRSNLARSRLAELGGEESTAALLQAYEDADILARIDTLLKLEGLDSPAVRALLRRLLIEPESYTIEREGERKTAAWLVRRFADQEMLNLLVEAVRMRDGRDVENLIYVAALQREKAIPLLREYRLSRMRYLGLSRGYEQEVLDWIIRRLESGLSIERYDKPPSRMVVR